MSSLSSEAKVALKQLQSSPVKIDDLPEDVVDDLIIGGLATLSADGSLVISEQGKTVSAG